MGHQIPGHKTFQGLFSTLPSGHRDVRSSGVGGMPSSTTDLDLCCLLLLAAPPPPNALSWFPNQAHTVRPTIGVKDSQHIVHAPSKPNGLSCIPLVYVSGPKDTVYLYHQPDSLSRSYFRP